MEGGLPILLVEDSQSDALLIQHAFRKAQIRNSFIHVANGSDGLKLLARWAADGRPPPAFVILDLALPDLSGYEVLRWIRKEPAYRRLPVVIVTGSNESLDHPATHSLGATAFYRKALCFEDLYGMIQTIGGYWLMQSSSHSIGSNPLL